MGIDTNGLWIKAGTSSDPSVGLSFSANAGLEGRIEVAGYSLASASGNIGFAVTPYVYITADPNDANSIKYGRVYLSDLEMLLNPINHFLDALRAGIQGDLTFQAHASVHLLFYKISWNWSKDIPVFNYVHTAPWPAAAGTPGATTPDPYPAGPVNGVLTFNGSTSADDVQLVQTGPGQIQRTLGQPWTDPHLLQCQRGCLQRQRRRRSADDGHGLRYPDLCHGKRF